MQCPLITTVSLEDIMETKILFNPITMIVMNTIITTTTNNALVARHIAAVTIKKNSPLMGVAKSMMIEEAKRQMRAGTCHFLYVKKDGSVREAFGTLNPALCNKHINGRGQSPETWGCTCYFSLPIHGNSLFLATYSTHKYGRTDT